MSTRSRSLSRISSSSSSEIDSLLASFGESMSGFIPGATGGRAWAGEVIVFERERAVAADGDGDCAVFADAEEPNPKTDEMPSHVSPPDLRGPFAADPTDEAEDGVGASPAEVGPLAGFGVEGTSFWPGLTEARLKNPVDTGRGFLIVAGGSVASGAVTVSEDGCFGEVASVLGVPLLLR